MQSEELEGRWNEVAREELRRLVVDGREPSEVGAGEFGPWAEYLEWLREAHALGAAAVRRQFLALAEVDSTLLWLLGRGEEDYETEWGLDEPRAGLPAPEWVVPELLPFGLATLVGRIWVGKTALALQMAAAVASGGQMLGRPVEQGKVLYLAIDHHEGQMNKWLARLDAVRWDDLHVVYTWPSLVQGGVDRLAAAIDEQGYRLVIVDTLAGVSWDDTPVNPQRRSAVLRDLYEVALERCVAIVAIDQYLARLRRAPSEPVWEMIDRMGEVWTADTVMAMHRGPGRRTTRLAVIGREVADVDVQMAWDAGTWRWGVGG